mmetsp:Transcript_9126/g.12094  ORF Transcript_9126/g.12094 Transcript_9126/m.12094 type:complete len:305 (+) Transcript_9126:210-1124(+)
MSFLDTYSTPAPGEYGQVSSCGSQVTSIRPSSPQFSFGASKTLRHNNRRLFSSEAMNRTTGTLDGGRIDSPGPGAYFEDKNFTKVRKQSTSASFGYRRERVVGEPLPQTTSLCSPASYTLDRSIIGAKSFRSATDSLANHSMGTASREIFKDRRQYEVPGPGSYHSPQSTPWKRPTRTAGGGLVGHQNVQTYTFGHRRAQVVGEPRPQTTENAAVGRYTLRGEMSEHKSFRSMGNLESNHTMGSSSREIFKERKKYAEIPGPGAYSTATRETSTGKQLKSTSRNAPSNKFGKTTRKPINYGIVG